MGVSRRRMGSRGRTAKFLATGVAAQQRQGSYKTCITRSTNHVQMGGLSVVKIPQINAVELLLRSKRILTRVLVHTY